MTSEGERKKCCRTLLITFGKKFVSDNLVFDNRQINTRQRVFFCRCEELIFRDTNGKSFNWMHFAGALSIIKRSILWVLNHYRKNNSLYLEMSVLNINDIYVYSFSFFVFPLFFIHCAAACRRALVGHSALIFLFPTDFLLGSQ